MNANTTGVNNTAIGSYTLGQNTTGSFNTVIGREAMTSNITGSFNTAIGTSSLGYNIGDQNTAVGRGSLGRNTSGNYNTGIGDVALYANTTGVNNTALGLTALSVNTTGSNNTAIGAEANVTAVGLNNTTAIGYQASVSASNTIQLGNTGVTNVKTSGTITAGTITYPNTAGTSGYYLKTDGTGTATWAAVSGGSGIPYTGATGAVNLGAYDLKVQGLTIGLGNGAEGSNTAFGSNVLKNNISASGIDNTAIGKEALYTNTSGSSNVGIGTVALFSNSTGGENSAFGMYSLYSNTTGAHNTGIGMHALQNNTTGNYNTAIGVWANVGSSGLTNATAIGYNAQATTSNSVRLGDVNVATIGGNVGWTAASDVRIKKNITNTKYGLSTVMQLRPVEYNLISNDLKQVGFIAQEVKKLVPEVVTGKEGDLKKGEILGITYANLVPVLTKAIQEQQTIIDNQNKRLSKLESLVKKLAAGKK